MLSNSFKKYYKRWLMLSSSVLLLVALLAQTNTSLAHAAGITRNAPIIAQNGGGPIDCAPTNWSNWRGGNFGFRYSSTSGAVAPGCSSTFAWDWTTGSGGTMPQTLSAEWDGPPSETPTTWSISVFIPNNHAGANARYWIWDGSPNNGYQANVFINQEKATGWVQITSGITFSLMPVVTMDNSGTPNWEIAAYAVQFNIA